MMRRSTEFAVDGPAWLPIDLRFADTVTALVGSTDPTVWRTLALASRRTREGHVCVRLSALAGTGAETEGADGTWPDIVTWRARLERSGLAGDGSRRTPLVIDAQDRLYLYRYWDHEQAVVGIVRGRLGVLEQELDIEWLRDGLLRLFPEARPGALDWQRVAVTMGLVHPLSFVVGGPGTGKTYTAMLLLLLLEEQALRRGKKSLGTLLLAPTGKAAARLLEVVRRARDALGRLSQAWSSLPDQAWTIHRALGASSTSSTYFYHHAGRPLVTDAVVVDEASMIDLPLMRRLLEAVPPTARLVFLGDADQLSSVEAGAVLSDLCGPGRGSGYAEPLARRIEIVSGQRLPVDPALRPERVRDRVVELTSSRRFSEHGGIGGLALALKRGDGPAALSQLGQGGEVSLTEVSTPAALGRLLGPVILSGYADAVRAKEPAAVLAAFSRFRVLCAHRRGLFGVEGLNQLIERSLFEAHLLPWARDNYPGRPILIEQNDYRTGLFNGDIGVVLGDGAGGPLRAFFDAGSGQVRAVSPAALPRHQTAFAMSIHKSQGSEFDHVAIVLPDPSSPLLTRELLYTAVSRARRRVSLYGSAESVLVGARRRIERASGLGDWA